MKIMLQKDKLSDPKNFLKKSFKFLLLLFFSVIFPSKTLCQSDATNTGKKSPYYLYFKNEIGYGTGGVMLGSSGTYLSPKNTGFSLSLKTNIIRSRNTPAEDTNWTWDYLKMASATLVKEFNSGIKWIRLGVEAGPALVIRNIAHFEYNNNPSSGFLSPMYNVTHDATNTLGVTIIARTEFLFTNSFGMELAGFANINTLQSVGGIGISFLFGKLR
jgi:hypothetical protein